MPGWISALLGAVSTAFVGGTITAIKRLYKRQKAENAGLQALLHDRVFSICKESEDKGFATIAEKRNLEYLYEPYHALGGNGTGTQYYKQTLKLPDKPVREVS